MEFGIPKMCHPKREKRNNRKNKTNESEKHRNTWRKRNLQVLENISNVHHQTKRNKRQSKEGRLQQNKETSRNKARQQKSYQRNKHLCSPPCKILCAPFFKKDKKGTQSNRPKDQETEDDTQSLTLERWHSLDICREKNLINKMCL